MIEKKEMKEIEEKKKNDDGKRNSRASITVSVTAGSFPIKSFSEWDISCKEDFGDVRWAKMWNDHTVAKSFAYLTEEISKLKIIINTLTGELKELKNKPVKEEPKDEEVQLFRGRVKWGEWNEWKKKKF